MKIHFRVSDCRSVADAQDSFLLLLLLFCSTPKERERKKLPNLPTQPLLRNYQRCRKSFSNESAFGKLKPLLLLRCMQKASNIFCILLLQLDVEKLSNAHIQHVWSGDEKKGGISVRLSGHSGSLPLSEFSSSNSTIGKFNWNICSLS